MQNRASRKRSVVKAITYLGIIVYLDFLVIYVKNEVGSSLVASY